MRLIDADALRKNAQHAKDISKWDGEILVVGLGHILSAPTIESPRPDWTPCAEGNKLPKFGKTVLITAEFDSGNRLIFQAYRMLTLYGSWYWRYANNNRCWQKVIAWQPLPDPYNPDRTGGLDGN